MKILQIYLVFCYLLIDLLCNGGSARAQNAHGQVRNGVSVASLIPKKPKEAFNAWSPIAKAMNISLPEWDSVQGKLEYYSGGQLYTLKLTPKIRFDFNALTGDVFVLDSRQIQNIKVNDVKVQSLQWLSEDRMSLLVNKFKDELYPAPQILNTQDINFNLRLVENGGNLNESTGEIESYVRYANVLPSYYFQRINEKIKTPNYCLIRILRDNGNLAGIAYTYRQKYLNGETAYSYDDLLGLARWYVAGEKAMPTPLKLSHQFTEQQKKYFPSYEYTAPVATIEEDAWLHQRIVWDFQFEFTSIRLDANTGYPVSKFSPSPTILSDEYKKVFGLSTPVNILKPNKVPVPLQKLKYINVNFNGEEYIEETGALHYPPIVQDNSPLILADYFPHFLINVSTKGDLIILEGLLPNGKQAELKLDKAEYILDGKPAKLSASPQKINNQIYFPAELLQILNNILIRWEPKENMLWVETRNLQR